MPKKIFYSEGYNLTELIKQIPVFDIEGRCTLVDPKDKLFAESLA